MSVFINVSRELSLPAHQQSLFGNHHRSPNPYPTPTHTQPNPTQPDPTVQRHLRGIQGRYSTLLNPKSSTHTSLRGLAPLHPTPTQPNSVQLNPTQRYKDTQWVSKAATQSHLTPLPPPPHTHTLTTTTTSQEALPQPNPHP
ncbi:unnamed protein product, partial [Sphacelaria rigidula]